MMSNDAEKAGMRWKSYFSLYDFSLILQVSLTIICSYLAVFVFLNSHIPDAFAYTDIPDSFDRGDIAELFDFGSGIFQLCSVLCHSLPTRLQKPKECYLFRLPLDYLLY